MERSVLLKVFEQSSLPMSRDDVFSTVKMTQGLVLMFSVAEKKDFDSIAEMIDEVNAQNCGHLPKCLVGCKSDLSSERTVSIEDAMHLANRYNMPYIECSARAGFNVNEVFELITTLALAPPSSQPSVTAVQLALFGDLCVGKTSFISKFIGRPFRSEFMYSVTAIQRGREIEVVGKPVRVDVWETANVIFPSECRRVLQKVQGFIVMFDATNRGSFEHVKKWVSTAMDWTNAHNMVLVCNKCDLEAQRAVPSAEGQRLAATYAIPYFETSAETGHGVHEAITALVSGVLQKEGANTRIRSKGECVVS